MLRARWPATFYLIAILVLYYTWIFIFNDNESLRLYGAGGISIIAGTISSVLLFNASRNKSDMQRGFWFLLGIGTIFYVLCYITWFYYQIVGVTTFYTVTTSVLWLVAYFFFFIALFYKTKTIRASVSNGTYIFNIIVFMTCAATLCIHYLIKPTYLNNHSLVTSSISILYPLSSLCILFAITNLYYLSKYSKEKRFLLYIVLGFSFQLLADTIFMFQKVTIGYTPGGYIDPIWLLSISIIGIVSHNAPVRIAEYTWEITCDYESRVNVFPYVTVIFLFIIVMFSNQWNFNMLSIGLSVVFPLIIGRQLYVMKKNANLTNEFAHWAYHDSLTNLFNRTGFMKDLVPIMSEAKDMNKKVSLLLIDLDRFKNINDTLGHYIGDCLLIEVSKRLKNVLGKYDRLYRLGGDEFVIIHPGATKESCRLIGEEIIRKLNTPFKIDDYEIAITPSIGISVYPENGDNSELLLKHADAAMYLAKGNGKNNYQFYNSNWNEIVLRKIQIENEIRKALDLGQFSLFYQPKVNLNSKKMFGMEALIRWEHPELGPISPIEFIPIAEETGQIVALGEWVLKTACKQNKAWQKAGFPMLCVSVNVSVRQLQHGDFVETVRKVLQETGLNPRHLELEITESVMQDIKETTAVLNDLKSLGIWTALDDFGKGYSSLHILKELPIDTIKIDKSFVDDVGNPRSASMIKSIIDIALNLNLHVIAEGIEDEFQSKILIDNKCGFGQGYLFSKPINSKEFEKLLINASTDIYMMN